MPIPDLILVSRTGGNYTSHIGFYGRSGDRHQFWARVVATLTKPPPGAPPLSGKRWYTVLHKFDAHGRHIGTDHWFAGISADGKDEVLARTRARRSAMPATLDDLELADIKVALFQVTIDGQTFGLVDVSGRDASGEWAEQVEMKPGDLLFTAPWRGSYSS
jgi:hypothetical protein